ncbi:MAG TPA: FliH/SctL family protein [Steroidobacteraceae bacterium]|nr:FliH/SctL family protein [Steroidobacteraceae bacterium]
MSEAARLRALAAAAAERWALPAVEGPIVGARRSAPTEAQVRAAQAEQARGYEAGLAAGRTEIQRQSSELTTRIQRLDTVLGALAKPLAQLDEQVYEQLTRLALAVGKQLARRELNADPTQVIALIREAVGQLPLSVRDVRVHLHPEDAAVAREHLAAPAQERAWSIVEDPTQSRGGCVVRTDSSQIDARFETRVQALLVSLLGEERAGQRGTAAQADATAEHRDER